MQLAVKVVPRSKENIVVERGGGLVVHVTAPPDAGQANTAALRLIAKHLGLGVSHIHIIRGKTARHKIIEVS